MRFLLKLISLLTFTSAFINTATANTVEYTWSFSDQVNGFTASADMFWDDTANSLVSSSFKINGTNYTNYYGFLTTPSDSNWSFDLSDLSGVSLFVATKIPLSSFGDIRYSSYIPFVGSVLKYSYYNSNYYNGLTSIPALTTVKVSAVPELDEYAMLLAGLGLVSAVVRRRKQANTSI